MPDLDKYDTLNNEINILRNELLGLQQKCAALNEDNIRFLTETAIQLMGPVDIPDILKFIANRLYAVTEDAIIIVSEYDPATSGITDLASVRNFGIKYLKDSGRATLQRNMRELDLVWPYQKPMSSSWEAQ